MTERVKGALSLWDMLVYFQDQLKSPGKFTSPSTGRVVLFLQGREVQYIRLTFPSFQGSLSLFSPFLLFASAFSSSSFFLFVSRCSFFRMSTSK